MAYPTPTVSNLKELIHINSSPTELLELRDFALTFYYEGRESTNWLMFHWLREFNRRYYYLTGTTTYPHDGGFTPIAIPPDPGPGGDNYLLLEDGTDLLLEDGEEFELEV